MFNTTVTTYDGFYANAGLSGSIRDYSHISVETLSDLVREYNNTTDRRYVGIGARVRLVNSASAPEVSQFSRQIGYLTQGNENLGPKGDNSVSHFKFEGELDYKPQEPAGYLLLSIDDEHENVSSSWVRGFNKSTDTYYEGVVTTQLSVSANRCVCIVKTYYKRYKWNYTKKDWNLLSDNSVGGTIEHYSVVECDSRPDGLYYRSFARAGTITDEVIADPPFSNWVKSRNKLPGANHEAAVKAAHEFVGSMVQYCNRLADDIPVKSWSTLASQAQVKDHFVEENIILFLYDVVTLKASIKQIGSWIHDPAALRLLELIKQKRRPTRNERKLALELAKSISGKYLTKRYVVDTFLRDFVTLMEGVAKARNNHSRTTLQSSNTASVIDPVTGIAAHSTSRVQLFVVPDKRTSYPIAMQWILAAKKWGMYPEFQNLWDIIPFSFVLDWFIPIGDNIESFDSWLYSEFYLPISHSISSTKKTVEIPGGSSLFTDGFRGEAVFTEYDRVVSPKSPLVVGAPRETTGSSSHWVEGTALALQFVR